MIPPLDQNAKRPALMRADTVFNVAYGSNLSLAKLRSRTPDGRTPIAPLSRMRVTVRGYRLVFGLATMPPVEPVMADAAPAEGAVLHGVMYEFSAYDYESLCMSENCATRFPSYVEQIVLAHPYEGEENCAPVQAVLFVHSQPERRVPETLCVYPSIRYVQLIVSGAREAGLDPLYIEKIEQHPVARAVVGRPAVLVTGLSMYCIFSLLQNRSLTRLGFMVKHVVFGALIRVYGRREQAARELDKLGEVLWATILFAMHVPLAIVGFILMVSAQAKVRIPFRE
jgi:hypothetical protein